MTIPNFVINVGVDSGGDVLVKDDITNPNLRYSDDGYATAVFTGVNSGSGRYTFTNVTSGVYRLYDGTSAVAGLGDVYVGESSVVTLTTTQTITGIKTFSGAVTLEKPTLGGGGVDITIDENTSVLTGNKFEVADAPTTSTGVARKTETDALNTALTTYYFDKRDGAANQNVYPNVSFRSNVTIFNDPAGLLNAANRKFVENYCSAILSGLNPSAYQQSTNIIRILYSGTAETGKVYTTIALGLAYAASVATSSRIMILDVQGDGAGGEPGNYNTLVDPDPNVHIHTNVPNNTLIVADGSHTQTALGDSIISGFVIDTGADSSATTFTNYTFKDCIFTNTYGSGAPSYTFVNCRFIGDCSFDNCTVTLNSACIGSLYDYDNGYRVFNSLDIIYNNGNIRPNLLLGRADSIASAQQFPAWTSEGNYILATGTTDIEWIEIGDVGEDPIITPGTRISLEFNGSLNIIHNSLTSGNVCGIKLTAGSNLAVTSGKLVSFQLNSAGTYWIQD